MAYPAYQFNLIKSIVATALEHGVKVQFRTKILGQYSSIMRASDPTHNAKTRGNHVKEMMDRAASELGGTVTSDLTVNGNPKKGTVRIVFP